MRIVCAPDSFKESMTAAEAAAAMARGIRSVDADIQCDEIPMADGGEGTTSALVDALGGEWLEVDCHDALNRPIVGSIGWIPERSLAVIEVAVAVGLGLISEGERDIWRATSHGVGELITAALDKGAKDFIIGLGGSATNDAGAGMLRALGVEFRTEEGDCIPDGAIGLRQVASVDLSGLDQRLLAARVRIACDVSNPLLGSEGASAVYGPQKGATDQDVPELDAALERWADVIEAELPEPVREIPGSGAAGGLGAAFAGVVGASMEPGVELVISTVGLRERLAGADWVFTGEGGIDRQTASGKTPWGVARAAAEQCVPAVLFGGRVSPEADDLVGEAVSAVVCISPGVTDLARALADGPANLERTAATVTRLLLSGRD